MVKVRRSNPRQGNRKEIIYKCNKCSYIVYISQKESPPTFCPNCALNEPKGEMIPIGRSNFIVEVKERLEG